MSEPDTEHAAGPVIPQTPVVSNYALVLTVYILYLVGFLTGACRRGNRLSSARQNGSGISITFPVSGNNLLDRTCIFFLGTSDTPFCSRCSNFALVGGLDSHQVR